MVVAFTTAVLFGVYQCRLSSTMKRPKDKSQILAREDMEKSTVNMGKSLRLANSWGRRKMYDLLLVVIQIVYLLSDVIYEVEEKKYILVKLSIICLID
jgi:hypothetical protein